MEVKEYPELLKSFIRQYKRLNENNWIKEIYTEEDISTDECITFGELIENICLCIPDSLKKSKITFVLQKSKNTSFDLNNGIIYLNISKKINTVISELFHELGHAIEIQNKEVLDHSLKLLSKKSNKSLKEITDLLGPKNDVWVPGEFIDPYVGKVYKDLMATEVVSMGFQYLYKNSADFEKKDPHHYSSVYRLLKYGNLDD